MESRRGRPGEVVSCATAGAEAKANSQTRRATRDRELEFLKMFRLYISRRGGDQVTTVEVPAVAIRRQCRRITMKFPHMIASNNSPGYNFAGQDDVFKTPFRVLDDAIRNRAFPGASVAVTRAEKLVALKAFGNFTYEADSPR